MKPRVVRLLLMLFLLTTVPAAVLAQANTAVLSGTVKNETGTGVADAKVTVKNAASGQTAETQTNAGGGYDLQNLPAGNYEISIAKEGFNNKVETVTLASGERQNKDLTLIPVLSVEGLGFPSSVTKGNAEQQARLDKRSHMLKMHQRLGLITTVPLVATLFTGNLAGGRDTSSTGRNVHAILGSTTAGLYFASASYAIFAPKIPGTETKGNIRMHKALAWIHGPGMVLTPILGAMAYQQKSNGERVHGIASAHVPVAVVTSIAYGVAIASVSIRSRRNKVRDTCDQP